MQKGNKDYKNLNILRLKKKAHCVKSAQMPSIFWSVFSCFQTEYVPENTPYLDTFHAVALFMILKELSEKIKRREKKGVRFRPMTKHTLKVVFATFLLVCF